MEAIIVKVNYNKSFYIFRRLNDDEYGYFEIIDSTELEVGDIVIGDFDSLGSETIYKENSDEPIDIIMQNLCSLQVAYRQVFE